MTAAQQCVVPKAADSSGSYSSDNRRRLNQSHITVQQQKNLAVATSLRTGKYRFRFSFCCPVVDDAITTSSATVQQQSTPQDINNCREAKETNTASATFVGKRSIFCSCCCCWFCCCCCLNGELIVLVWRLCLKRDGRGGTEMSVKITCTKQKNIV